MHGSCVQLDAASELMASGKCMHGSHPTLVDHGRVQSTGWCKTLDQYILGVMLHHGKTHVLFPGPNTFSDLLSLPRDEKTLLSPPVSTPATATTQPAYVSYFLSVESSIKAIFNVC